jgi:hypothetical protein
MASAYISKAGIRIAVVAGSVMWGSAFAECPSTLDVEELEYCIVCEGSGMTYEECKSEAALESSTSEQQVSDTSPVDYAQLQGK